jgi:hypothetical protein
LKNKTENVKSIVDIEERVRQDMSKTVKKILGKGIMIGRGMGMGGRPDTSDIEEKINAKNLPPHVKE